jgi:uncharacterized membrane protein SpoIIM required for sporulation
MVLEELVHAKIAEQKPIIILPIAFLYASIAMFIALWIFPSAAAVVTVFLITIATMPLFLEIIFFEKQKEETTESYLRQILMPIVKMKESKEKLLAFFVYLFLGLSIATAFWFAVLPSHLINDLFNVQLNTIREINVALSGAAISSKFFGAILLNNLKVLAFSVLFSFIYGAGAIFILAWNASVIGVAMGDTIRSSLASAAGVTGAASFAFYGSAVSIGLLRFLIHGVPEIAAYFVGALAGGMLSIAIINQEFVSGKLSKTVKDIGGLMLLSISLLVIAAIVEVTISPNLG